MKILLILLMIFILFEIPTSYGMGLIFNNKKLGFKKGIIPFYNKIILIKKYKLPQYHLILIFIPIIGLYTNFIIYSKLTNNKNIVYTLELTILPFIFNIILGLEKEQPIKEQMDNYFEDQKGLYSKEDIKTKKQDEYVWHAKPRIKSDIIYKASRNKLNAKVNLNLNSNNRIIDNKRINEKESSNTIICPNCGTKLPENTQICFVCGTKI